MNSTATDSPKLNNWLPLQSKVSPRLLSRKLNIIRHAVSIVEEQTGHVTNKAVADYLGVTIDEYNCILQDVNLHRILFNNHKQEVA
jgi:hypothetical protein